MSPGKKGNGVGIGYVVYVCLCIVRAHATPVASYSLLEIFGLYYWPVKQCMVNQLPTREKLIDQLLRLKIKKE